MMLPPPICPGTLTSIDLLNVWMRSVQHDFVLSLSSDYTFIYLAWLKYNSLKTVHLLKTDSGNKVNQVSISFSFDCTLLAAT
jgi:hypothetical protein